MKKMYQDPLVELVSLGTKMAVLGDSFFENVIFCNKRLHFVHASTIGGTMRCL